MTRANKRDASRHCKYPAETNWGLIDNDTPREFLTKKSYVDDTELELVFSDEFNQDGRTFFPGGANSH